MGKILGRPKLEFRVSIKGEQWKVKLYTGGEFDKISPGNVGLTVYNHNKNLRTMHFKGPNVSRDTIAHELFHALLSYRDFSKTSYGKIEEEICEEIGKSYKKIYKLTNKIYSLFSRTQRAKHGK